jgi:hypothetical protein
LGFAQLMEVVVAVNLMRATRVHKVLLNFAKLMEADTVVNLIRATRVHKVLINFAKLMEAVDCEKSAALRATQF